MLLRDAKIYVGQYDISGDSNQVGLIDQCTAKPKPTFGSTTIGHDAGLFQNEISGSGFLEFGTVEAGLHGKVGTHVPFTVSAPTGAAGDPAYFMRALKAEWKPLSGQVGELLAFTFSAKGSGITRIARGLIFVASGARAASFNSSVFQLGAVAANQRLIAAMHVFSASGSTPTLNAIVKSDDASGFASPTNRLTFAQATTPTSEFLTLVGPLTDTHFRVDVTIGGSSPSFSVVIVVGVGS